MEFTGAGLNPRRFVFGGLSLGLMPVFNEVNGG